MAPTPKKRHSTYRKGKRRSAKNESLPEIVYDKKTGKPKLSHRVAHPLIVEQENTLAQIQKKEIQKKKA